MSNFFKRLSLTLDNSNNSSNTSTIAAGGTRSEYPSDANKGSKALSSAVSFNDFSMHVMTDGDHYVTSSGYLEDVVDCQEGLSVSGIGMPRHSASIPIQRRRANEMPFVKTQHGNNVGKSVPIAGTPSSPISYDAVNGSLPLVMPRGMNLKIHPGAAAGSSSVAASLMGTPKRHSVDAEGTPRSSLELCETASLATPRASLCCDEVPSSPTSPTSPGSNTRKRRQSKIHGMDYYEFCELVRAGSL